MPHCVCLGIVPGMLCRSTLLTGLQRGVGTVWAVILSAFLFCALHGDPLRFAPQMVLGIVLAIVTLRCRSIIPAMIIHAGHNSLLVAAQVSPRFEAFATSAQFPTIAATGAVGAVILAAMAWRITRSSATGDPAPASAG